MVATVEEGNTMQSTVGSRVEINKNIANIMQLIITNIRAIHYIQIEGHGSSGLYMGIQNFNVTFQCMIKVIKCH